MQSSRTQTEQYMCRLFLLISLIVFPTGCAATKLALSPTPTMDLRAALLDARRDAALAHEVIAKHFHQFSATDQALLKEIEGQSQRIYTLSTKIVEAATLRNELPEPDILHKILEDGLTAYTNISEVLDRNKGIFSAEEQAIIARADMQIRSVYTQGQEAKSAGHLLDLTTTFGQLLPVVLTAVEML